MFGSILALASSVARAASKYHLLLRDPHFSVNAVLVSSTGDQGGTFRCRVVALSRSLLSSSSPRHREKRVQILRSMNGVCDVTRTSWSIHKVKVYFRVRSIEHTLYSRVMHCYILTAVRQTSRSRLGDRPCRSSKILRSGTKILD